jgi:hypothetical protein
MDLKNVTILGRITEVSSFLFSNCEHLKTVTIPDSVTLIDHYAFFDCKRLSKIIFGGTKAQWKAISKGEDWKESTGFFRIKCKNATIFKFFA